MAAGFSDAALTLGLREMVNRTFWIELHTADPGDPVANTPLTRASVAGRITPGHNGYYGQWVPQNGFIVEGTSATQAKYSNDDDVDFGTADNSTNASGWGLIGWISIWYDGNAPAAANPGQGNSSAFDTLFSIQQLQTNQQVNTNDPFVIRADTIDLIGQNA